MVISGYNIISEVHRGPVTTVYRATHLALGRHVLLKVLNPQWSQETDLIDRIRREAKICARIDHENIVKIYDFGRSADSMFISMEFVEGATLETLIHENELIDFEKVIDITSQILTGLSYAHRIGIIHRDIKPSNIMITSNGHVKITDFGLAVVSDLPGITSQDQAAGSPAYMSPEQALGKDLDQRSDLFSLGITLYKICTKKSPFETDNIGTTIQNILTKQVDSISDVNANIPNWFSELSDSLLAKNRDNRPESASSVLNIISSNYKPDKMLPHIDGRDSANHQYTIPGMNRLSKYKKNKIHSHIFLLATPIVIILAYLIFMIIETNTPEKSQPQIPVTKNQFMNGRDTVSNRPSEINIEEKYDVKSKDNQKFSTEQDLTKTSSEIQKNKMYDSATVKPPELSKLFIIANPWAEIYVDGIYQDATPLSQSLSLLPGSHLIELKNPNHLPFSRVYDISPAQSETLIVDLILNVGFLNIRILPWAKVYIDGEYRETTPIDDPITLASGEHIVTLTNPNYKSIIDTIEIVTGKIHNKNFKFSQ